MDFYSALGVPDSLLSASFAAPEHPSEPTSSPLQARQEGVRSDVIHSTAEAVARATTGEGPILKAIAAFPDPAVIIEKFRRLERYCTTTPRLEVRDLAPGLLRADFPTDTAAPAALAEISLRIGCLLGLLQRAGIDAAFTSAETRPEATDWVLRWSGTIRLPELDNSASAQISDHLQSLIAADPARGWRIEEAAAEMGLSSRSLQRYLLAEKQTFSASLRQARTQVASRHLRQGKLSLAEIGYCCGYADQAHFQREFRKTMGITPRKFRLEQMRG